MKKLILTLGSGILCSVASYAQNEVDALRYSNLHFQGTARFSAMGSAFGALGADFSNLSVNPAGIALYKRTELTFTPTLLNNTTSSSYNNSSSSDSKSNFHFGNIGLVATHNTGAEQGWVNTNFAIGYNKINNFHNRISISGDNTSNSFLDILAKDAKGSKFDQLDPYSTQLAWNTYLIDTVNGDPYDYFGAIPTGTPITQRKSIESRGGMGETVISFGGNYSNKLHIGATFGFDNLRYEEESAYSETDINDSINGLKSYTYNSNQTTKGTGFNFKFGIIYRVNDWIRFGGAIHTPTYLALSDDYNNKMTSYFDNGTSYTSSPDRAGRFDYRITTPMRAIGSVAVILAKKGCLSADYEFVDYSSAVLSSSPNVFFSENDAIRNKYASAGNLRVGTEWRVDPFTIRAGYSTNGNVYKPGAGNKTTRTSYSGGFGIKEDNYFLDFAYVLSQATESYYLYSNANPSENTMTSHAFMMTLGFRY